MLAMPSTSVQRRIVSPDRLIIARVLRQGAQEVKSGLFAELFYFRYRTLTINELTIYFFYFRRVNTFLFRRPFLYVKTGSPNE